MDKKSDKAILPAQAIQMGGVYMSHCYKGDDAAYVSQACITDK